MPGSRIIAVVFDLDDTLYPERQYAFSGFDAVAAAFADDLGDRTETVAQMRELFDSEHRPRVFSMLAAQLYQDHPDEEELVKRMIQTYREHSPTISLHDDADAALTRLCGSDKSRGPHKRPYALGLITDGPALSQSAKIAALSLRPRFDAVVLTDDLGPGFAKPHPQAFELVARQLAVSAEECVYIADNAAKDFVAPNALGWTTIQIRRADGIYLDNPPAEHGTPDHVIETLNDLDVLL